MTDTMKRLFTWRMMIVLLLGISSGLPLAICGATLKAWLTYADVDVKTVGFFGVLSLPYNFKFVWSPLLDRYSIPFLGERRKSWMLVAQTGLIISILGLAFSNPPQNLGTAGVWAVLIAFFGATQDIAIDAYRREILEDDELGMGTSLAIGGYRVGQLLSGGLALMWTAYMDWSFVFAILAALILVGSATAIFSPAPKNITTPKTLREAVIEPFRDFLKRKNAYVIMAFILLFKFGDAFAASVAMPFYKSLGIPAADVGLVVKLYAFWAIFVGAFVGGLIIMRIGIFKSLWVFGAFQILSTYFMTFLIGRGPDLTALGVVMAFENFTAGAGTAAFAAYMASLTNREFTGTQFALFSSLTTIMLNIFGGFSGVAAESLGWNGFFIACSLAGIPGMLLLWKVAPWNGQTPGEAKAAAASALPA